MFSSTAVLSALVSFLMVISNQLFISAGSAGRLIYFSMNVQGNISIYLTLRYYHPHLHLTLASEVQIFYGLTSSGSASSRCPAYVCVYFPSRSLPRSGEDQTESALIVLSVRIFVCEVFDHHLSRLPAAMNLSIRVDICPLPGG